jgi:ComF family protein
MNIVTILAAINKINLLLMDILFPIHCLICRKEGIWLCESCQSRIKIKDEHHCPACERVITPDGRTCFACKKKSHIDGLVAASFYAQFPIANAVHLFKYRFVNDLHWSLGDLLVKIMRKTDLPLPNIITSVPLHPRRLRWRGFNQSELLGRHLASNLLPQNTISFDDKILIRSRYTAPQMGISNHRSRQHNIADAFSLSPGADIKNKTVLLVDDIATTGATLFECAKVLKKAGASEVFAIVVARQTND